MMSTQLITQIARVQSAYLHELLNKRNVVGIGIGYKRSGGELTGELSLIVSVTRKESPTALAAGDMVPHMLEGIKTDVVETGLIRAFDLGPRDRWRPVIPPGVSVGHHRITAGTFGCLVRRGEEYFILSNNHVLANMNEARIGDPILQPAPSDGGSPEDRIATLADFIPLDFGTAPAECPYAQLATSLLNYVAGAFKSSHRLQAVKQTPGVNRVDAALARPVSPQLVSNAILYVGTPTGTGEATLGMRVQKTGRTTGHTTGVISQIEATMRIQYDNRSALFTGQLVADAMSKPGDSGSAVLDMDGRVVGLLFAGSDYTTIINPIGEVLSALNVELA
jgi:hypothetical protein